MIKNYIITAFRNLSRKKFYSFLNIAGLAIGIAVCLLIMLWVTDELNYDKHLPNSDRIYRAVLELKLGDQQNKGAEQGAGVGRDVKENVPGVEEYTRVRLFGNYTVEYNDILFKEEHVGFVDSTFFTVFKLPFIEGDPEKALSKPNTVVLSESCARKYFGDENPVGKVVRLDNRSDYTVTGVIKDIPENTHFYFDVFGSLSTFKSSSDNNWLSNQSYLTYFLIEEGYSKEDIEAGIHKIMGKYIGPESEKYLGLTYAEFFDAGNFVDIYMQPVEDIHLYSEFPTGLNPIGDISYVYIFSAIALFILILACINFTNLSTARSANRAREVGLRKVLGSDRKRLILQFFIESLLLSFIAFFAAMLIASLLLPLFNEISGKSFAMQHMFTGGTWMILLAAFVITGLLAGTYPALFLSSFRPAAILRGEIARGAGSGRLRSVLVVFQFTITIVMIIATIVVFNQLDFIQSKKLGYDKDKVLLVNDAWIVRQSMEPFKTRLLQHPGIENVSVSSYLPTPSQRRHDYWWPQSSPTKDNGMTVAEWHVDNEYLSTMGLTLVEGRDFDKAFAADSASIIVNEAFVKKFGIKNPIGTVLNSYVKNNPPTVGSFTIIGVIKNFHSENLKFEIAPLILKRGRSYGTVAIKYNTANVEGLVADVQEIWNEISEGQPFDYSFLDTEYNTTYKTEVRIGELLSLFAILTIVIGSLGLLGLTAFTAEQRRREIGIRKVLGVSASGVVMLLSKEFTKLILISFVLAVPVSYYLMSQWLEDFAYRTSLQPGSFLLAGAAALLIALLTVSYHAMKSALMNPVNAIKNE